LLRTSVVTGKPDNLGDMKKPDGVATTRSTAYSRNGKRFEKRGDPTDNAHHYQR
jgi:hypothetical protein